MVRTDHATPYTRHEVIGRGSYGIVYKGIHNQTRAQVAIKVLNLDTAEEEVTDIQKEIVLLQSLKAGDAQNVCKYHGSFLNGTRLWIIMDYCEGGSIRTLMKSGRIEEKYIVIIIREVLIALQYIHKADIIHRDIKAANVLVTNDGRVQLCDFGVAAQLAANHFKRNTFVGTPYWMAPEVISDGLSYNFKADIWSLGITIYEIAMGNPPYSDQEPMRAVFLIPRSSPPRLEGSNFSSHLKDFVAACLCTIPEERPTAAELAKLKVMKNSSRTPTVIMRELIGRYEAWRKSGGVRQSLNMINGADDDEDFDGHFGLDEDDEQGNAWDFDTARRSMLGQAQPSWEQSADATEDLLKTIRPIGMPQPASTQSSSRYEHPLMKLFGEEPAQNLATQSMMELPTTNLSTSSIPHLHSEPATPQAVSIEMPALNATSLATTLPPVLPAIATPALPTFEKPSVYRSRERPVLGLVTRKDSADSVSLNRSLHNGAGPSRQNSYEQSNQSPTTPVSASDKGSSSQGTPRATSPPKTFKRATSPGRSRPSSPTRIPMPSPMSPPSSPSRSSNTHSTNTSASSMASILPKTSFNPSLALQHLHLNNSTQSLPDILPRPSISNANRDRSPSASAIPQLKHAKKPSNLILHMPGPGALTNAGYVPSSPSRLGANAAAIASNPALQAYGTAPFAPPSTSVTPATTPTRALPMLTAPNLEVLSRNDHDLIVSELSRVVGDMLGQLQYVEEGLAAMSV